MDGFATSTVLDFAQIEDKAIVGRISEAITVVVNTVAEFGSRFPRCARITRHATVQAKQGALGRARAFTTGRRRRRVVFVGRVIAVVVEPVASPIVKGGLAGDTRIPDLPQLA